MADVFISYSRKDRARAETMANALKARGVDVWWDTHLKTGAEFRQEISQKLEGARAVIVIWSEESVASRFVCDEADVGAQHDTLFPVLVDLVDIPLGFRQIQTADLTRWRGKASDRLFRSFIDIIADVAGGKRTLGHAAPSVAQEAPTRIEPVASIAVSKPKRKKPARASRSLMMTGQKARVALIFRSLVLAVLVAGSFGVLASVTNFVLPDYRNYLVGGLGGLVFITRYMTFQADRKSGGASLRLLSRSYAALFFFALIASAPFLLEGRLYAAVMQAVRIEGVEGADINAVSFDASGARIATSSDDKTVRIWDAQTGVQLSRFPGHEDWVWAANFSPDGARVVSASRDLTARVWSADNGEEILRLSGHTSTVRDALYDPKARYIVTASHDKTIRLWDPETGEELRRLEGHTDRVTALAISRDGSLIASASSDGTVRLWHAPDGSPGKVFSGSGALNDVAFSRSKTKIAAVSDDGTGFVWDVFSGQLLARISAPDKLFGVRFADQDRQVATVGLDGLVRLWSVDNGAALRDFTGHEGGARGLDVSDDGALLISGSRDNTARIWDVASGAQLQIMGHITPAIDLPRAIDQPPYFAASRAPVPVDLMAESDKTRAYAIKGLGIAAALLGLGIVLRFILRLVRQTRLSRWMVVGSLGTVAIYVATLMLSAFPAEATFLWLTIAFVPMTVLVFARWIVTAISGGRL